MFLSDAAGAGLLLLRFGRSVSSSARSSSSRSGFDLGDIFGSEAAYFGGDTGESSSSASSSLLRPLRPGLRVVGGGDESALRPGDDRSSGRMGLSSGKEGLKSPKCLSDRKDRDSEVRTNCSRDESEVGWAEAEFEAENPAPIRLELVVEDTEDGLDGSSSLSSLLS